jgi:uncharacterized protein DUF3667
MQPTFVTCKSCGTHFQGRFCNNCGEKVFHPHDKSLTHFIEEAFHFITHFDTKIFRSLRFMLSKPGFVAMEFCEGRRRKYFSPVSMFMIGVVIYLLFPVLQGLNISFDNHISNNNSFHFYLIQKWAVHKASVEQITLAQLAEKFDHLSPKFSKVLLLVLIPLSALALSLLFTRKKKYFFDHMMLAAEINSVILFLVFLILPVLFIGISKILPINLEYGDNVLFLTLHGILVLLILFSSFKRFYHVKFLNALLKAFLFIILYMLVLHIYRLIVFSIVMLFI